MRKLLIDKTIVFINKQTHLDNDKIEIIRYGLEGIYILITKTIIFFSIAFLLGIAKELLIFMIIYSFIRMPSFGIHATKSWICLIGSGIIFLFAPYICTILEINIYIKAIIGIIMVLLFYKYAPADTAKRPIINKKRRHFYKIISTLIAMIMSLLSLIIINNFIANCLIISLIVQYFMISPITYHIFNLSYNNYKNYAIS